MPFVNPSKGECGTYFIGYAGTLSIIRKMPENMFIGVPEGNADRCDTLFSAPRPDCWKNWAACGS
jgi:deferrochelatase/peroxidase EfeB